MGEPQENPSLEPVMIDVASFARQETPPFMKETAVGIDLPTHCYVMGSVTKVILEQSESGDMVTGIVSGVSDPAEGLCYIEFPDTGKFQWVRASNCKPPIRIIDSTEDGPPTAAPPIGVSAHAEEVTDDSRKGLKATMTGVQTVELINLQLAVNNDGWSDEIPYKFRLRVEDRQMVKVMSQSHDREMEAVVSDISPDGLQCKVHYLGKDGWKHKWVDSSSTNPPLRFVNKGD